MPEQGVSIVITGRTLVLCPDGDPYGGGYVATEYSTPYREGDLGLYRGDLGARPRSFWRRYAREHGYRLREWRNPKG